MAIAPGGAWRRRVTLFALIVLLAVLGLRLYSRGVGLSLGAKPAALTTAYKTEEEWVVGEIARDLAEMGCYAAERAWTTCGEGLSLKTLAPGRFQVKADLGGSSAQAAIALEPYLWAPDAYAPLVAAVLRALGASAPASAPEEEGRLAAALLDLRAEVLARQSERVSGRLERGMLDPRAHEEAALLLGAFALREAANGFSDSRGSLSRSAAHLAMARVLRSGAPGSFDGRLAEVLLLVLAGRGADAQRAADALDTTTSETAGAWQRVVALALRQDIRVLKDPGRASLVERIEYYRALSAVADPTRAVAWLEATPPEPVPDWGRITEEHFGAVSQRGLLEGTLPLELDEARAVGLLPREAGSGLPEVGSLFAVPQGRCLTPEGPRVLGRGLWAAFLQRHLMHHAFAADQFYRRVLAAPEMADAYQRGLDRLLKGAPLYPVMDTWRTRQAEVKVRWLGEAVDLAIHHPELITAHNWVHLAMYSAYEPRRVGMPSAESWFRPAIPRGTAFDVISRKAGTALPELLALAPEDYRLQVDHVRAVYRDKPTAEDLRRTFGARVEYDQRVLRRIGATAASGSAERVAAWERLCELDANNCFELGSILAERGDEAAAARAYERAVTEGADEVTVANNARWLVRYYHRRGRGREAAALAERAATTYSAGGLKTQAWLFEETGRYEEAEQLYRDIKERYPPKDPAIDVDGDVVLAFLYRMARVRGVPAYEKKLTAVVGEIFPRGLEKASLADFQGRPADGVWIETDSPRLAALRLSPGDVIVALDGWRVRNTAQYYTVRDFTDAPEMRLTVFHQGGYVEAQARSPNRRFGVGLRNFPVRGWSDKGRQ